MNTSEDNILLPLEYYINLNITEYNNFFSKEKLIERYNYIKNYNDDNCKIDYKNLNINCINCTKCFACVGCRDCIDCIGCCDCVGCEVCDTCIRCYYCRYCKESKYSIRCVECKNCTECYRCTVSDIGCQTTSNCCDCVDCVDCDSCISCTNCVRCINCTMCIKSIDTKDSNICINIENYDGCNHSTFEKYTGKLIKSKGPIESTVHTSNSDLFKYKVIYNAKFICQSIYTILHYNYSNSFILNLFKICH